ncbi:hypothetical protein C8R44DRAFT_301415 [Mycena epipterygia]|nr:hypothetical protein C8R44DRAFT_301415 [Mycena epipterygia]
MLPDEIISEILSPALKVSDELFSDTSEVSPFADYSPSTSAYLLVCKDWLRVATPLLYNVVVLRSKGQANTLEKVLRSNPDFGCFIKKLRVEGGYGLAMHTILQSAPNITDVSLSLSIWSSDGTQGLCEGLPLINPRRVLVVDPPIRKLPKNQHLTALTTALFRCIRTWDNLEIFGFPYAHFSWRYPRNFTMWTDRRNNLAQALTQSQTLHTIIISEISDTGVLALLLEIPSLKVLKIQKPFTQDDRHLITTINSDPRLKQLTRYTVQDLEDKKDALVIPDIAPSLNPFFVPMASASDETREVIWNRVFFFAMYVKERYLLDFPRGPTELYPSRVPILLVSKYFQRLALPHIYRCPRLTLYGAPLMARQLQERPDLGSFIRVIYVLADFIPEDAMLTILSHATNVEKIGPRLSTNRWSEIIPVKNMGLLAQTSGSSLQEFSTVFRQASNLSASVFAPFTALRLLELSASPITFTYDPTPENELDKLQSLSIQSCNESLLVAFSMMRLKSLHTLKLNYTSHPRALAQFLNAHGGRLIHLSIGHVSGEDFQILGLCTALVDIEFYGPLNISRLTCDTPHQSLAKIVAADLLGEPEEVAFDMLPALREMQIRFCVWPTTERAISKSKWVALAKTLLEKNIKLTDSAGKHWIPRVQSARARRR